MIQDSPAPFRADGLRAAGEESTEETNRAVWVISGIDDVLPTPLAAIVRRVELGVSARAGDGLRNKRLHHIEMEYETDFVLRIFIRRTDVLLRAVGCSTPAVGKNANPCGTTPVVSRSKVVDHVVEATVAAFHTKRSKELAWFCIAEVFLNRSVVTDDSIRCFGAKEDTELRSSVHHAERIDASTITNHFHADGVQDSLRQVRRRKLRREHLGAQAVWVKTQGGVLWESRTSDALVTAATEVFVPSAILPCIVRVLGKNIEHHPKLLLTLECETKIVHADRRGVQGCVLQVVGAKRLSKRDHLIRGEAASLVVGWVVTRGQGSSRVVGNSGPCKGVRWERALVGGNGDFGSHFVEPGGLTGELVPR